MSLVRIAVKTITAIETTMAKDQGASFRVWLGKIIPHMQDAYRGEDEAFRSHLGASIIGQECARATYLSHRWATASKHTGQLLRLFNRGHLEEARFIALLCMIGCVIYQQDGEGKQYRISHACGHAGGSGDGIGKDIPDIPDIFGVCEFKTHNDKSFIKLAGKNWRAFVKHLIGEGAPENFTGEGVKEAKWEHYVQMQTYMAKFGLAAALYMAVNKNTDDVYAEIVLYDPEIANQYLDNMDKLVWMENAPKRLSNSPGFFKCSWCDHKPVCHLGEAPARNCRTCVFSQPIQGDGTGQWVCNRHTTILHKQTQLTGCPDYQARKF